VTRALPRPGRPVSTLPEQHPGRPARWLRRPNRRVLAAALLARSTIVVVAPTGSGWVDPAAVGACSSTARASATPRAVVLTHASDPVPAWSPALLVHPPPETTDADLPRPPWLPGISFLQTSVDLLGALAVPPGPGHRYGAEHAGAWSTLLGHAFRPPPVPA
jgi:uncharacterized membrane protein